MSDRPRRPDGRDDDDDSVEAERLAAGGPRAGRRAAGLAFLGCLAMGAVFLALYLADRGGDSFSARLNAELLAHAELSLASRESRTPLEVVPHWPIGLYRALQRDFTLCLALVGLAAGLWGWSARLLARRDAYLVHKKLSGELAELRERLKEAGPPRGEAGGGDAKG